MIFLPTKLFNSAVYAKSCRVFANSYFALIHRNMSKKAVVILAPGAEEMEFTISADVLRRGGVDVTVAGLEGATPVKCSRGVVIVPDLSFEDAVAKGPYDVIVMPGGLGGSKAMASSPQVGALLKEQEKSGRLIAAICAAPTALKAHSIGHGKKLTSYPSTAQEVSEGNNYSYQESPVVTDGNLITSRGPGTAIVFALTLVEALVGKDKAKEVAKAMLYNY